jgi:hypothetical protein
MADESGATAKMDTPQTKKQVQAEKPHVIKNASIAREGCLRQLPNAYHAAPRGCQHCLANKIVYHNTGRGGRQRTVKDPRTKLLQSGHFFPMQKCPLFAAFVSKQYGAI